MLTWMPDPAAIPWSEVQEDEIWEKAPITASDPDASLTVTGYSYEIIGPEPIAKLHVATSAAGVVASAPESLSGMFPPVDIEYQIKRVTGHCKTFADLPKEADEIIKFLPHPINKKEWTVRVTAHCNDVMTGVTLRVGADFILLVRANYTPGRNALKEVVDARRH